MDWVASQAFWILENIGFLPRKGRKTGLFSAPSILRYSKLSPISESSGQILRGILEIFPIHGV